MRFFSCTYSGRSALYRACSAGKSYLNIDNIMSAALVTKMRGCASDMDLLPRTRRLPEACAKNGIKFIGPEKEHMEKMGNKSEARKIMAEAGIPIVPGSENTTSEA